MANGKELPDVVTGPYPRAFSFRASEQAGPSIAAGHQSYETWAGTFNRLGGIMGKSLEEEVLGRSANIPHFSRFKREHPDRLVMIHYNGNARDPRDAVGIFSPEHWVYFNGCRITRDVEGVAGETELHVADPNLFRIGMGRYRDKNEDIGICMLDDAGAAAGEEVVVEIDVEVGRVEQLGSAALVTKVIRRMSHVALPQRLGSSAARDNAYIWGIMGESSSMPAHSQNSLRE